MTSRPASVLLLARSSQLQQALLSSSSAACDLHAPLCTAWRQLATWCHRVTLQFVGSSCLSTPDSSLYSPCSTFHSSCITQCGTQLQSAPSLSLSNSVTPTTSSSYYVSSTELIRQHAHAQALQESDLTQSTWLSSSSSTAGHDNVASVTPPDSRSRHSSRPAVVELPSLHTAATGPSRTAAASLPSTTDAALTTSCHPYKLNSEQLESVNDFTSPAIMVTAGPGSGKTRVIVTRVAIMIRDRGVQPSNIGILTFTRKAATELRQRLQEALDMQAGDVWAGTFHSFCASLLGQHGKLIDPMLLDKWEVAEESAARQLLNEAVCQVHQHLVGKDLALKLKKYASMISMLKSRTGTTHNLSTKDIMYLVKSLASANVLDLASGLPTVEFIKVLLAYNKLLVAKGQLDYDDLLGMCVALLNHKELAQLISRQYRHLLVDEFQDTNVPQYVILHQLRKAGSTLFVVGDVNQAIYTWRGAEPAHMNKSFHSDNITAHMHQLKCNHRSKPKILIAANFIMQPTNMEGARDALKATEEVRSTAAAAAAAAAEAGSSGQSTLPPGGQVTLITTENAQKEAEAVVRQVQQLHSEQGLELHDIAILYRTNRQARVFEEQLQAETVPYCLPKSRPFWSNMEVQDILNFLKLVDDPLGVTPDLLQDTLTRPHRGVDPSAHRMRSLRNPKHCTPGELVFGDLKDTFSEQAAQACVTAVQLILHSSPLAAPDEPKPWHEIVSKERFPQPLAPPLPQALIDTARLQPGQMEHQAVTFLRDLVTLCRWAAREGYTLPDIMTIIVRATGYEYWLQEEYATQTDCDEKFRRLHELSGYAWDIGQLQQQQGCGPLEQLRHFMQHTTQLVAGADAAAGGQEIEFSHSQDTKRAGCVQLLTLHAAKGLEFKAVIIVGCSEGLLPHFLSKHVNDTMEEQRLMYVGATRASDILIFTWAALTRFASRPASPALTGGDGKATADHRLYNNIDRQPPFEMTNSLSSFLVEALRGMHSAKVLDATVTYIDETKRKPLDAWLKLPETSKH